MSAITDRFRALSARGKLAAVLVALVVLLFGCAALGAALDPVDDDVEAAPSTSETPTSEAAPPPDSSSSTTGTSIDWSTVEGFEAFIVADADYWQATGCATWRAAASSFADSPGDAAVFVRSTGPSLLEEGHAPEDLSAEEIAQAADAACGAEPRLSEVAAAPQEWTVELGADQLGATLTGEEQIALCDAAVAWAVDGDPLPLGDLYAELRGRYDTTQVPDRQERFVDAADLWCTAEITEAREAADALADRAISDGTYLVGTDVAPGRYRVAGYWSLLDGSGDIIENDAAYDGITIVDVPATAALVEISGHALPFDLVPVVDPIAEGYTDGTYLVGTDIAPGTYRVLPVDGRSYWALLDGALDILDNDLAEGQTIVTVTGAATFLTFTGTLEPVG